MLWHTDKGSCSPRSTFWFETQRYLVVLNLTTACIIIKVIIEFALSVYLIQRNNFIYYGLNVLLRVYLIIIIKQVTENEKEAKGWATCRDNGK